MAVIHLTFDIDSDVHPELHAMLSAMANAGARGERLRQLASTGLIWERVRIENPVPLVLHSTASLPAASKADVEQVERLLRADAEGPAQRIVSAPVASDMAAAARRRPATARGTAAHHMIEPEVDPLALREFEPEFQVKARDLPELFDVLDLDEYPQPLSRAEQRLAEAAPHGSVPAIAAEPVKASTVKRVPVEVPELVDEVPDSEHMALHPVVIVAELETPVARPAPIAATVAPADGAPLLRKKSSDVDEIDDAPEPALPSPPPRSRLMRMKERGLFKNE